MPIRKNISRSSLVLFWLLVITDCIFLAVDDTTLHPWLKPLFVPLLLVSLIGESPASKSRRILIAGLVFAWAGDILLLREGAELYFIGGLVCFLITHILYSWYFIDVTYQRSLLKQKPWLIIILIAYVVALCTLLFPKLGSLKIPVLAYAGVLACMLLACLHAFNSLERKAATFFTAGATLFVISDSLLAIDKFYKSFSGAAPLIILTYCAAQFLITTAFLKTNQK